MVKLHLAYLNYFVHQVRILHSLYVRYTLRIQAVHSSDLSSVYRVLKCHPLIQSNNRVFLKLFIL